MKGNQAPHWWNTSDEHSEDTSYLTHLHNTKYSEESRVQEGNSLLDVGSNQGV
ncbi:hypothetical protein JHK82_050037 [Glycine max]|nr:hypothetical protein JHK82_050037 [Glycine max]